MDKLKKTLVVDWLDKYGGAERVISLLEEIFDFNEVHTLVNLMDKNDLLKIFPNPKKIHHSKLQIFKQKFRLLFPSFYYFTNTLKINRNHELVISSSHAIAKGVKTHSNQIHISYFQARNMKYIWDESKLYFGKGVFLIKPLIKLLRKLDVSSAQKPDLIIVNSKFVQKWVQKTYNRSSIVVYPPVNISSFNLVSQKEDYFVTSGRLVHYKRFDLIIRAFNKLNKRLIVIGDGYQAKKLKRISENNISFTGFLESNEVANIVGKAKAYVYAGIEDFGIAPVEAQACGTPVVCLNQGGTAETIINNKTGLLFNNQSIEDIIRSINQFESMKFDYDEIRKNALRFSNEEFRKNFTKQVNSFYSDKKSKSY